MGTVPSNHRNQQDVEVEGPIVLELISGRQEIGFPSDSLNRNFRHMALKHPLLATLVICLDIL